ncbi:uncharacterized protein KY384_005295 [Bacidia gigantensis]|uniref:uncharacterized protein n=1 Tax=Bacidia gigantensis TaxID=2732470 RepID=UPI001D048C4A|nr:uncharacterized protein KY384_005295 [Bacidia gigantensis]KAG8529814.1 hypothetical protein KY384_005295 [Bacidia gigantensis]
MQGDLSRYFAQHRSNKFSNLLGKVYCKGNLLFTPDGTTLISPVGNRVTVFDLVNDKSYTLPCFHRRDIVRTCLNSRGNLLLSVDEDGRCVLTNFHRRLALYHFTFKHPLSALAFSPSGRHFAAGGARFIEVWHMPDVPGVDSQDGLEFAPFRRHRIYAGHHDQVQHIEWSNDSRFFLSASKDLTARIWSADPEEKFSPTTLAGHRESLLGAWFSNDQEDIYTVSQDGALFQWNYIQKPFENGSVVANDENGTPPQWRISQRHYFMQNDAKVMSAAFHAECGLLVVGFSNGLFGLYEMPDCSVIHTLSISKNDINAVTLNLSGEWLAFGSSKLGQLLVWEWQSESYILKQQGHFDSITDLAFSPDGQRIITAADDGKIKVWDAPSGFCTATFTEHTSSVTGCEFARKGNVLFTSSLDGSVRAWDLVRYRNFRAFSAPTRLSFSCLAVDPSGEVVCAGSTDSFDIHIWSVQTGQLLDQLSGHEGPVSSMAFASTSDALVSGSWDNTVRIWSIFGRTQTSESLQLPADILAVAFRPDSKQVAVSTLDGQLTFWSSEEGTQESGIDNRRDASGGRKLSDRRIAANTAGTKSFNCIVYSADGTCILAGGRSKYICLYDVQSGTLLKKITTSANLSLDGTQEFLNSRNLTDAGPKSLLDENREEPDFEDRLDRTLPRTIGGTPSSKHLRQLIRTSAISFSPTSQAFCAATTEGLLIYSLDTTLQFDPFDLEIDITIAAVIEAVEEKDYLRALVLAFRLNEKSLIRRVYAATPTASIDLVAQQLPRVYLARLMGFINEATGETPPLELNLLWIEAILSFHGGYIKGNSSMHMTGMRSIKKTIAKIEADLSRLGDENVYTLDYLLSQQ